VKLEISKLDLQHLVEKQIDNLFLIHHHERNIISRCLDSVLERCEYCFKHTQNKYYSQKNLTYFNPFHSGQYSIFLYFLSSEIFHLGEETRTLADRIYYLNKCMNGLDLLYEVNMPRIFFLDHPVGSVIGRATFGDYFAFSQNCTVGNNKGEFPVIGDGVSMQSGAKIVGKCKVGDNVIISANSYVKDVDIPSNSIVFGSSPNLILKKNKF